MLIWLAVLLWSTADPLSPQHPAASEEEARQAIEAAMSGCHFDGPMKDKGYAAALESVRLSDLLLEEAKRACAQIDDCKAIECTKVEGKVEDTEFCDILEEESSIVDRAGSTLYLKVCDEGAAPRHHGSLHDIFDDEVYDKEDEDEKDDKEDKDDEKPQGRQEGLNELEDVLQDFWATETLTFAVEAGAQETLYEDIAAPLKRKTIKAVFFASNNDESDSETVWITVLDPDNKEVHSSGKLVEGAFAIHVHKAGTYKIVVKNTHLLNSAWVTIMFGGEKLRVEHMEHLEAELSTLEKLTMSMQQEDTYLWQRQSTALHAVSAMNLNCLALRTFEFLVMTFMATLQVIYVRSLCSHRRVI